MDCVNFFFYPFDLQLVIVCQSSGSIGFWICARIVVMRMQSLCYCAALSVANVEVNVLRRSIPGFMGTPLVKPRII